MEIPQRSLEPVNTAKNSSNKFVYEYFIKETLATFHYVAIFYTDNFRLKKAITKKKEDIENELSTNKRKKENIDF